MPGRLLSPGGGRLPRLRQIVTVLVRAGFGHFLDTLPLRNMIPFIERLTSRKRGEPPVSAAQRLRMAFEELGPTFVKLGQMLASRPDLVPEEFIKEMAKLHDQADPFPWEDARLIIEEELGAPVENLFTSIDPEPRGAASIAQVHLATLSDGREVMVKIQRPKIREMIEQDLSLMTYLALLGERSFPEIRLYKPVEVVEEFRRTIFRELDFQLEGAFTDTVRENFKDVGEVVIPAVFWESTTTRVLTLERVNGVQIDDPDRLAGSGLDKRVLATTLARAFIKQVVEDGLFHADPHPGNLLALPGNRIAFLDFGMIGRLEEDTRLALSGLFLALINKNYGELTREYVRLTSTFLEEEELRAFQRDLTDFLEPYLEKPLNRIPMGEVLHQGVTIALRHQLAVPPEFFLLARGLITLEGTLRQLDPAISLLETVRPLSARIIRERYSLQRIGTETARTLRDLAFLLRSLPESFHTLIKKTIRGDIKIDFVHQGLGKLIQEMDRSSNRASFAIVTSAIIIASSLILLIDRGYKVFGYPILGLAGYTIAGFMGVWLLIAIIRSGKL